MKEKLHHYIILHDSLYNKVKYSQSFPYKQLRKYFRNRYIKNNFGKLNSYCKQNPIGQVCIETTNLCNTSCTFCPHDKMRREKKVMCESTFKTVVKEIKKMKIRNIGMYYFGEPLTDPRLDKRINLMKKNYPCYIQLITNGLGLNGGWRERLRNTDLDELLISLDATDKESYEKIRKGSYENVVKNIEAFMLKKGKKPKVIVRIMVTEDNKNQIKEFTRKWKEIVDEVQYGRIHNFSDGRKHLVNNPCLFLWSQLIILSNGDIIPCCIDYDAKLKLGNINSSSLDEIWNGNKMRTLRNAHLMNIYPSICKNCDMNESLVARWWNYD